ncbi:SWIB/MDM2 domain-containing protein [Cinnamomum micranthum f. kanehirae]|uniref:SWIB/MDM2 domain-containing protein n=1 Tax=Cinnamomum micranthum f. kanehirae TaxID=337451 RepID=A0A3S3MJZ9_9MAGN|nr:SWIB/MDM2 domain-containing protein [Cinnamomum micranthum f. kanehirae]
MATISLGFSSSVFKNHQLQQQQQQQAVFTKAPTPGPGHANLRRTRISCAAAKREPRGITKPRPISIEMQELLGVAEIPRTQALKQIWAYIKQHNLQDPENKKIIVCDEKLKKIFAGKDRVGFLEVSGLINPHFL